MSATNNNNGWRHPKTTSERRQGYDEEHSPYIRGKRRNLPDAYDDLRRSSDKNYKSKKIQQLDKDSKFFHLEIRSTDAMNVRQNMYRIEEHLEKIDVSYNRMFKFLDGEPIVIIEWRGKSIGDWVGCKYL